MFSKGKFDEQYVKKIDSVLEMLGGPTDPRRWGDSATVAQFQVGNIYHITHIPDPKLPSWYNKDSKFQVMHQKHTLCSVSDPRTAWLALGRPRPSWLYLDSTLLKMHSTVCYLQGLATSVAAEASIPSTDKESEDRAADATSVAVAPPVKPEEKAVAATSSSGSVCCIIS